MLPITVSKTVKIHSLKVFGISRGLFVLGLLDFNYKYHLESCHFLVLFFHVALLHSWIWTLLVTILFLLLYNIF